jgi:hypothetical protein
MSVTMCYDGGGSRLVPGGLRRTCVERETFDQFFDRITDDDIEAPATGGLSTAEPTAIGADALDGTDVPEDERDADGEADEGEAVEAEGEAESEEEPEAEAEVIPISDARHPDHAVFQEAEQARQQKAILAQARVEYANLQRVQQLNQTIEALPDLDPATLPGTVRGLIAQVVAPVRQRVEVAEAETESAAGVATGLHLAMVEHLPPEWVDFIVARSRELQGFGSVEAASHVVNVGKQVRATENAEIKALREENALLKKTARVNGRDPNADRVPVNRPASAASRASGEGESKFDKFFDENVLGR